MAPKAYTATGTQNEYRMPVWVDTTFMIPGKIAPPDAAAVRNEEPVLVWEPKPRREMPNIIGQMADY